MIILNKLTCYKKQEIALVKDNEEFYLAGFGAVMVALVLKCRTYCQIKT